MKDEQKLTFRRQFQCYCHGDKNNNRAAEKCYNAWACGNEATRFSETDRFTPAPLKHPKNTALPQGAPFPAFA